jgi:23S rRNA pseudouridine2605 synthase
MSKNFKKKDSFSSKDKKEGGSFNSRSSSNKKDSKESFTKKDAYRAKPTGSRESNSSDKKRSYNDFKKTGSAFSKKEGSESRSSFRDKNFTDKKGNYKGSEKDFKAKPAGRFDKNDAADKKPAYGNKSFSNKKDSFKKDYKDKPAGRFDKKDTSDRKSPYGSKSFSDKKDSFKKDYKNKPAGRFDKKDASENKPSFRDKKFSDRAPKKEFNSDSEKIPFKPRERSFDKNEDKSKRAFINRDDKKKEFTKPYNKSAKSVDQPKYDLKKPRFFSKNDPPAVQGDTTIRLNKYISNAGVCSRRDADKMIEDGMIKVNGKVVTEMGYKVNNSDIISYGKRVLNKEKPVYVLLNKPKDFITTMDDPNERRTVMDLVGAACKERIYPVGRLDRNTTGLLLLTNDGELAEKLTHPSNEVKKVYQVDLDKPLTDEDMEKITSGLQLEDGPVRVDDIAVIDKDASSLGIEIHEGRNRIVRRIFEHLGYQVVKLDRVMYAGLDKKDLPRGKWRYLSEKEVIRLKYFM